MNPYTSQPTPFQAPQFVPHEDAPTDTPTAAPVEPRGWRALQPRYAAVLLDLRRTPPFSTLDPSCWATLSLILASWVEEHGTPSPQTLVTLTGWSRSTVFRHLTALQALGILRPVSEESAASYGVGPVLRACLRELVARFTVGPQAPSQSPAMALARQASPSMGLVSDRESPTMGRTDAPPLKKKNNFNTYLSAAPLPVQGDPAPPTTGLRRTPRAMACDALAALFRRNYPDDPPPRVWGHASVDLIVACMADGTWEPAAQPVLHLDGIEGALSVSRGPPTAKFIWADLDTFMAHVHRGRAIRFAAKQVRPKTARPPDEPPVSIAEQAVLGAELCRVLEALPSFETRSYRKFDFK